MTTPRQIADWLHSNGYHAAAAAVRLQFVDDTPEDFHRIIKRIEQLMPTSTVSLSYRDSLCVAALVGRGAAFERKGAYETEACMRLLDSVMQWRSEQAAEHRRKARGAG